MRNHSPSLWLGVQSQLGQAGEDLLSSVTHDLRAPISNIKLAARMVKTILSNQGIDDEKLSAYLKIIEESCEQEDQLIDDLILLSSPSAVVPQSNWVEVNLSLWLPVVLEPFSIRTAAYEQRFEVNICPGIPHVLTVPTYLHRAVSELIHNACKYTPPHETISVSAKCLDIPGAVASISIANTGVSLSEVEASNLFCESYRVPRLDVWKQGGSGLGLAIVKKLVALLKGEVSLTAHQNAVAFTLNLPCLSDPF